MGSKNTYSVADLAMGVSQTKRLSLVQSNPDYGGDVSTIFLIFGYKVSLNLMTSLILLFLYIPT